MQKDPNGRLSDPSPSRGRPSSNRFTIPLPLFPKRLKSTSRGEADTAVARRPESAEALGPTNCLWVNQIGDRIVGLVRLAAAGAGTARIVAFRVDPEWYHTAVVRDLIQAVKDHCRQRGCLRVLVDFNVAPPWMPSVLKRHGFRVAWRERTWEAVLEGVETESELELSAL